MYYVRRCVCVCVDARVRACMCMYVGYDVGVSCVATVVVTDCLWLQLCLINLSSTRQQLSDSILLARYFPVSLGSNHFGHHAPLSTFVITCMI